MVGQWGLKFDLQIGWGVLTEAKRWWQIVDIVLVLTYNLILMAYVNYFSVLTQWPVFLSVPKVSSDEDSIIRY